MTARRLRASAWRVAIGLALAMLGAREASAGHVLDGIRERGAVTCGVNELGPGLTARDARGQWVGFYVDFCRALAAAVLGQAERVDFRLVPQTFRIDSVRDGTIDVMMGNTTWTLTRDAGTGVRFAAVVLYDGQGFLAWRKSGVPDLKARVDDTICVIGATTTEHNLAELTAAQRLRLKTRVVQSTEGLYEALSNHQCDLVSSDRIALTAFQRLLAGNPDDFVLLPDVISREPIGPMVPDDDPQWFDIVKWTMFALIAAEDAGITKANAQAARTTATGEARRLLGVEPGMGAALGLDEAWALHAIEQVGNYGEIFDRHLGAASALHMPRGLNDLWRRGGLMYAPPLR